MLSILALASVVVVALLHLGFMVLEATQWNTPLGRKLTHLGEEAARETVGIGINMGIYNGFLGAALLWVTFAWGVREAYSAQWLLLTFIVFAGVVGAITNAQPWNPRFPVSPCAGRAFIHLGEPLLSEDEDWNRVPRNQVRSPLEPPASWYLVGHDSNRVTFDSTCDTIGIVSHEIVPSAPGWPPCSAPSPRATAPDDGRRAEPDPTTPVSQGSCSCFGCDSGLPIDRAPPRTV